VSVAQPSFVTYLYCNQFLQIENESITTRINRRSRRYLSTIDQNSVGTPVNHSAVNFVQAVIKNSKPLRITEYFDSIENDLNHQKPRRDEPPTGNSSPGATQEASTITPDDTNNRSSMSLHGSKWDQNFVLTQSADHDREINDQLSNTVDSNFNQKNLEGTGKDSAAITPRSSPISGGINPSPRHIENISTPTLNNWTDIPERVGVVNGESWITTENDILSFVDYAVQSIQQTTAVISLDCEGNHLSREGTLSQVTLSFAPECQIVHLDFTVLGKKLFTTPGGSNITFQHILESIDIPILVWDVRGDSDSIYHHANVRLEGIIDLQVMKWACNLLDSMGPDSLKFVRALNRLPSLADAVSQDLSLSDSEWSEWKKGKEEGRQYCELHGWKEYDKRPLAQVLRKYAAGDVVYLPHLYVVYYQKLSPYPQLMIWVIEQSSLRAHQSTLAEYNNIYPKHMRGYVPEEWYQLYQIVSDNGS